MEIVLVVALVLAIATLAVFRFSATRTASISDPPAPPVAEPAAGSTDCVRDALLEPGTFSGEPVGEDVGDLADAVEETRELRFSETPEPIYLRPAEFSMRVRGFVDEYSDDDADEDSRILSSLGAIEEGTDLKGMLRKALGEQVAGFYDPDTRQLVVGTEAADELSFLERVTLAHELEHALADQALGLPLQRDEVPEGEEDAQAAATALVEGDATLTMTLVSFRLAGSDPASLLGEGLEALAGPRTDLPHHIQRSLLFPYEEGLGFACSLYSRGGWDAVDAAYREPPATTAEVLFPERYGRQEVEDPPDPADPAGWGERVTQAFGAADLLFLFEAPGGDPSAALDEPRRRVSVWRGGEVHLWARGDRSAVALALLGDDTLCGSVKAWQRAATGEVVESGGVSRSEGGDRSTVVRCGADEVRVGVAPDGRTAEALVR